MVRTPQRKTPQKTSRSRTIKVKLNESVESDNFKQTKIDSFFKIKRKPAVAKVERMDSSTDSESTISLSQETVISNGTIEYRCHAEIEEIFEDEDFQNLSQDDFHRIETFFATSNNPFKTPDKTASVSRNLFKTTSSISCSTPIASPQPNVNTTTDSNSGTDIESYYDGSLLCNPSFQPSSTLIQNKSNEKVNVISDVTLSSSKKTNSPKNKDSQTSKHNGSTTISTFLRVLDTKESINTRRRSSSDFEDANEKSKPKKRRKLNNPGSTTPGAKILSATTPTKKPVSPSTDTPSKNPLFGTPVKASTSSLSISPIKSPNSTSPKKKKMNMKPISVICEIVNGILEKRTYSGLFEKSEIQMLKDFVQMEDDCKYFLFKLFMYLPKWYNVYDFCEKIKLDREDHEIKTMYESLKRNGYITFDYKNEDITTLINLLTRANLKRLCETFRLKPQRFTKDLMVEALLKNCKSKSVLPFGIKTTAELLREKVIVKLGYCMKLSDNFRRLLRNVYLLHTFTNSDYMKPSDFFNDIVNNCVVFPEYKIEDDFRVFYTRNYFISFAKAYEMRVALLDIIEKKKDKSQMDALEIGREAFKNIKELLASSESDASFNIETQYPHLQFYTAAGQYISILTKTSDCIAAKYPEEVKTWLTYLLTLDRYKQKFGLWYSLLAKILDFHCSQYDPAADTVIKALESKAYLSEIDLEEIAIRARRLKDSVTHKISNLYHDRIVELLPDPPDKEDFPTTTIQARAIRSNTQGRKRHYLVYNENGDREFTSVEEIAMNHYRSEGYPRGRHCEGSIIRGAFALLFWDIIYSSDVQGVFISGIQMYPLDFKSRYFYQNRREGISRRLENIIKWPEEELFDFLTNIFQYHSHEQSIYNLGTEDEVLGTIKSVISSIDREVLSAIFERLVQNYRVYSSGMPDLLMWNEKEKKCKFVEVKGENDKLSTKQKFWLKYLKDIGADVEVCYVEPIGSKMKSMKKLKMKTPKKPTMNKKTE